MLNPIQLIKQLYTVENLVSSEHHLDKNKPLGIHHNVIEQHEKNLGIQLPAILYHYLHELGEVANINHSYHHFIQLPFKWLGEYLVIGSTCDNDAVWGIHKNALTQHNPMVQMSRNFDAIEQSEVHWFDELPLSDFLLALAIINGTHQGLTHHAQIYDFVGDTIPQDLSDKLEQLTHEILELRQSHERFFQADNFSVVMVLNFDGNRPTAFTIGSQSQQKFEQFITTLSLGFKDNT